MATFTIRDETVHEAFSALDAHAQPAAAAKAMRERRDDERKAAKARAKKLTQKHKARSTRLLNARTNWNRMLLKLLQGQTSSKRDLCKNMKIASKMLMRKSLN